VHHFLSHGKFAFAHACDCAVCSTGGTCAACRVRGFYAPPHHFLYISIVRFAHISEKGCLAGRSHLCGLGKCWRNCPSEHLDIFTFNWKQSGFEEKPGALRSTRVGWGFAPNCRERKKQERFYPMMKSSDGKNGVDFCC